MFTPTQYERILTYTQEKDFVLFESTLAMRHEMVEIFKDNNWIFDEYMIYRHFGEYQICIEFCIGDFCVGIYKATELQEPKKATRNILEALLVASQLEEKYNNNISVINKKIL